MSTTNMFGFQAVNHGIESSFLDHVRELAREFFHLPTGEKQKYVRPSDDFEGYGNDTVLFDNQSLDWVDRLYLLVHPQDQQKLKYLPENPVSFRDMLYDCTARLRQVEEQLLKSMARSLSLPEDTFVIQFGERPSIYARFNYYPPCARPDLVVGLKPHADGSGITILLQDQ
ncbi:UNVERIFIED_CONTAM: Codeine O-demethylase [Sesamum angustifolium]|uniref:Codeine O-demethylase n=1 Tax=Sesamum angustifolium TaxID=2727405 RepID=A0AAW2K0C8_9LAMI